jgi:citrate synthase
LQHLKEHVLHTDVRAGKALDIPVNMFTVMFAMGRMAGWIAQWQEMRRDPQFRIGRPRQVYTGHRLRHYTSIDQRA